MSRWITPSRCAAARPAEPVAERLAEQVLHDEVRRAVVAQADVEHLQHVLVEDLRARGRLEQEPRALARLPDVPRVQDLHGHRLAGRAVLGEEDLGHAPLAEQAAHLVAGADDHADVLGRLAPDPLDVRAVRELPSVVGAEAVVLGVAPVAARAKHGAFPG